MGSSHWKGYVLGSLCFALLCSAKDKDPPSDVCVWYSFSNRMRHGGIGNLSPATQSNDEIDSKEILYIRYLMDV